MSGLAVIRLTTQGTGTVQLGTVISPSTHLPLTMTSQEVEHQNSGTSKITLAPCADTIMLVKVAGHWQSTEPANQD